MQDHNRLNLKHRIFIDLVCGLVSNENMTKLPSHTIIDQAYDMSEKMFDKIQKNEEKFIDYKY
jgi:hypothetical protein